MDSALRQWILETNRRLTALEVDGEEQVDLALAVDRQRVTGKILLAAVERMDRQLAQILLKLEGRDG